MEMVFKMWGNSWQRLMLPLCEMCCSVETNKQNRQSCCPCWCDWLVCRPPAPRQENFPRRWDWIPKSKAWPSNVGADPATHSSTLPSSRRELWSGRKAVWGRRFLGQRRLGQLALDSVWHSRNWCPPPPPPASRIVWGRNSFAEHWWVHNSPRCAKEFSVIQPLLPGKLLRIGCLSLSHFPFTPTNHWMRFSQIIKGTFKWPGYQR